MKSVVKKNVYKDRTKKQILKSIENGVKEVALFLKGEIKLPDAKYLFKK